MSRRIPLLRVGVLGALWLAVSIAALLSPGCYGRNCEGTAERFDTTIGGGYMLNNDRWVSGPVGGDWLPFPRQRTWIFDIPELGGRTPEVFTAYISAVPKPAAGGDSSQGAGNLAKFLYPRPNGIDVYNDSCSDYYLRLVVDVAPFPPVVAPGDGGAIGPGVGDASVIDASDADGGDGG